MDEEQLEAKTKFFALRVMKLFMEGVMLPKVQVVDLYQEADEITAIMTASHMTAVRNR